MTTARTVVILGSTGSIGRQALDIIRRNPDRLTVLGLASKGSNPSLLVEQAQEFKASHVSVADEEAGADLADALPGVTVDSGPESATQLAGLGADVVLNGMSGSAGLPPTLAALGSGSTLALANKESLVAGGSLVLRARRHPDQIVPVDSEHSALAQALRAGTRGEVRRLILTASGGPFRGKNRADLERVTPAQALAHPTWTMGPVVTVNSATLINKALEVIEAYLLFDVPLDRIEVVVHPQSEVHSMVEFWDGSTIAQASQPDMSLPISLGLAWPDRIPDAVSGYDWSIPRHWSFETLDEKVFPAVRLARDAVAASPLHPAVFNAANEEAVAAFLDGALPFLGIVDTIAEVLEGFDAMVTPGEPTLESVLAVEAHSREVTRALMGHPGTGVASQT